MNTQNQNPGPFAVSGPYPGGGVPQNSEQGVQQLGNIAQAVNQFGQIAANLLPPPILLSGSSFGSPIKVVATSTPGTLIHTAGLSENDQVYLWASNTDGSNRLLTLEWGDDTSPDHHIENTVTAHTSMQLVAGGLITSSRTIRAYAAAANVITVWGYALRRS